MNLNPNGESSCSVVPDQRCCQIGMTAWLLSADGGWDRAMRYSR